MKKIFVILMLLFPMMVNAQIKLFPKIAASYSYETLRVLEAETDKLYDYDKMRVLDILDDKRYNFKYPSLMFRTGLDAKYKNITVYYDTKIWCKNYGAKFDPHQAIFEIGVTYNVTDKIKVNVHHTCLHPLSSDNGHRHDGLYGGGSI